MEYNFKKIEKKWQKKWAEKKVFEVDVQKKEKKFYLMEMFPYPSALGLHLGHALNYTIWDILARFKRMNGFNVLYPMGFDAMGLPAENAAIKVGEHPKSYTAQAIKNYIKQMKDLGLSYDWSKMVNSMEPEYYRWNQFFFLKFLEKGLAYRKKAAVNWCSKCNSVLANEQVVGGCCWRHEDTEVEIKHLEQWFLKITDYADELLECIDDLQWPQKIKTMQKNWIGKSHGTEIDFEVGNGDGKISNVVIVHGSNSTEDGSKSKKWGSENLRHWKPWIKENLEERGIKVSNELYPKDWIPDYEEWKKVFEKNKIDENSILIGHSAGTAFILRWLAENKRKVKKVILVAPSVIPNGKYLGLSKLKNFEFDSSLKKYFDKLVIFYADDDDEDIINSAKEVNRRLGGKIINLSGKGHFTFGDMKTKEFPELLEQIISKQKFPIFTTRPDTIYGVTFMVISAQHEKLMELVTKEQKKEVEKFLKKIKSTKQEDMDNLDKEGVFTGSYAINPVTKEKVPVYAGNFVVAEYGSGMVMGVPAHDKRDFDFAKKYDLEIKEVVKGGNVKKQSYVGCGKLINSEKFNGLVSEKAKQEITKFLEKKRLGRKKVQFKMRDWLISRQRYWGTPIPIVYCDKCGIVPVDEKDLPIKLPIDVKFGKGNPLATNEKFVNVKCPKCKGKARRETDTMDTFVDSSWYFMRYPDNKNSKVPFDKKIEEYWLPVDQYIGGIEHATMHLLYARFWTKALRDLGYVNYNEPFTKLFNQGMLHGEDGEKMSKSKGNVILPEVVSEKYGIDTARFFLMSLAAPDKPRDWSDKGVQGSLKFINKVMGYFDNVKICTQGCTPNNIQKNIVTKGRKSSARIESKLNKTIKEVTEQIENFKYNLAVIKIRELFNSLSEEESKDVLEKSLKLLHPFCPHITEELWEKIGNKNFITSEKWPIADEKKIDGKFEKQEQAVEKLKSDIEQIKKLTGKKNPKVYVYVLPNELELYKDLDEIKLFAVNDKKKYDPENKSKKVKPGRPGIYLE